MMGRNVLSAHLGDREPGRMARRQAPSDSRVVRSQGEGRGQAALKNKRGRKMEGYRDFRMKVMATGVPWSSFLSP